MTQLEQQIVATLRDQAGDGVDVTRLLDAARSPVLAWRFRNAFPAAYRLSPLVATSSEVVLETVELVFDSMDAEAT